MKHFFEARQDALNGLSRADILDRVRRVCLIVDLQGRCRVLAEPVDDADRAALENLIADVMAKEAEAFWAGKDWIQKVDATPSEKALYDSAWKEARASEAAKVHILDRRLSKDAWFGTDLDAPWPLRPETPPIISFYSFKGGVGRTTLVAAVAVNLARAGRKTVVVDFDLEAPGVGDLLRPADGGVARVGIVDYLLEHAVIGGAAQDLAEFYHRCDDPAIINDGEPIVTLPAGRLDEFYLEKLARINYAHLYATGIEPDAPRSPLHDVLRRIREHLRPDVILVDSRAGLHDIGGLTLSGLAHLHVLLGLDSAQSWNGLAIAIRELGQEMILAKKRPRACAVVHAMAPPLGRVREAAIQRFHDRSFDTFSTYYYETADSADVDEPVPDAKSPESAHFPAVLTWDGRISGYNSLADIANWLCDAEYRSAAQFILGRVGRRL
jgi:hypothetical protein